MIDRAAAVDLLHGLVAIRSLSCQEGEAARWLVDRMRRAGYDRAYVDEAGNAIGELGRADAGRTLVLLGHIDTVPGNIAVRIERTTAGDVLYGRGSVDAKGPLATFVVAAARVGTDWAETNNIRLIVVGAVEEEAATSKGARAVAARFDGVREPIPLACVIGEPSHWHRITLGYKGRLLLDFEARQPMAHTAGPDAGVASVAVDLWNQVSSHARQYNAGRDKAFDQLSPSLRRFVTTTTDDMIDCVDAQIAWRLPLDVAAETLASDLIAWAATHLRTAQPTFDSHAVSAGRPLTLTGERTVMTFRFRGWEKAWRSDRQNALVRSFLAAIRSVDDSAQPGFLVKTGTSDMNVVGPIWRCPIVAYGPGDSALDHTPNEHLSLDEYWRAIEVMERMLAAFAAR